MVIFEWRKCPDEFLEEGQELYLRSTFSYLGPIMVKDYTDAGAPIVYMRPSSPEITPRRYSVVIKDAAGVRQEIISMAITTHFDDTDEFQPHKKYISGEKIVLQSVPANSVEEALEWTGIAQHIGG